MFVLVVDSFKLGKAVMISFAVGNPIDQYNCRFNNLGDDAKCACLPGIRWRLPTWDDEITGFKLHFEYLWLIRLTFERLTARVASL